MSHAHAMSRFRATDGGFRGHDCAVVTRYVGPAWVPEIGTACALFQCRACLALIAVYRGRVLYEIDPPPAAVPADLPMPT